MHAKTPENQALHEETAHDDAPALGMLVDLEVAPAVTVRAGAPSIGEREAKVRASVPAGAPVLAYGTALEGSDLTVQLEGGPRPARRAKSCLVAVSPGDRVLCSVSGDAVHVLAVLESADAGPTRVVADGGLALEAAGEIALRGETLRMRAKSGTVAIDQLKVLGRAVEASFAEKASLFAERVESRASRVIQRAKQAFRFVTELEQARVGNYDLRAESLAAVRGENTIVSARVLTKLDGEQVKIG